MKCSARQICYLALEVMVLSLLSAPIPAMAEEPTLARLAFWVPPERMEEFGAAYAEQVAPVLKKHGLAASSEWGRATVDSVFSRLFEMRNPAQVAEVGEQLALDEKWREAVRNLGASFNSADTTSNLRTGWKIYSTPMENNRKVPTGPGSRKGSWQRYGISDGLPAGSILPVLEDRKGRLWFGTGRFKEGSGAIAYDGVAWTLFSIEDGLADNNVKAIIENDEGHFWFGTEDGLTLWDGHSATTFTREDGLGGNHVNDLLRDREGNIWVATDQRGVSCFDGNTWTSFDRNDGLTGNRTMDLLEDRAGRIWVGVWGKGVSRFDGQRWITITEEDGIGSNYINRLFEDDKGNIWLAAVSGITRFDGEEYTIYTAKDVPGLRFVEDIAEDRRGRLWFGTFGNGVIQYNGDEFKRFTTDDGLAVNAVLDLLVDSRDGIWAGGLVGGVSHFNDYYLSSLSTKDGLPGNLVTSIVEDRKGHLWFTMHSDGVAHYNGTTWHYFTRENGLAHNNVWDAIEDSDGRMWFATSGGISVYDGEKWESFTVEDGLNHPQSRSVGADSKGNMWFGTDDGIVRYDGEELISLSRGNYEVHQILEDSEGNVWFGRLDIADNSRGGVDRYDGNEIEHLDELHGKTVGPVQTIFADADGSLWFGTWGRGALRFDGREWTRFTTKNGLVYNVVLHVFQDRRGHMWFGTWGGGVVRTDGLVFQPLQETDGLAHNGVQDIIQLSSGEILIATEDGVTRYRVSTTPPSVDITDVKTDHSYGVVTELKLDTTQDLVRIEFQGSSMSSHVDRMLYVYHLTGRDIEWKQTRSRYVELFDLPSGEYTFEVRAVDHDLNYSEEPARVRIHMHLPYGLIALYGSLGLTLVGLTLASGYALRKRRDHFRAERALMHELEEELQTAHDMQMDLMPTKPPEIESFDITGRCLPANHVGGDFFQYFPQDGKLAVCMADVTGHAMEAAVPVMMFSGILKSQMEIGGSVEEIFGRLNRSLHGTLDSRTFVCFTMGELDTGTRTLHLVNGGCPYPYHFQASTGGISELQLDAYPLAIRPDSEYQTIDIQLDAGDRITFCSDGIIEAENVEGEIYGFERTAETIRQACAEDLSAEALIDRLIGAVQDFAGDAPQGDDMTVVVLKVEA